MILSQTFVIQSQKSFLDQKVKIIINYAIETSNYLIEFSPFSLLAFELLVCLKRSLNKNHFYFFPIVSILNFNWCALKHKLIFQEENVFCICNQWLKEESEDDVFKFPLHSLVVVLPLSKRLLTFKRWHERRHKKSILQPNSYFSTFILSS